MVSPPGLSALGFRYAPGHVAVRVPADLPTHRRPPIGVDSPEAVTASPTNANEQPTPTVNVVITMTAASTPTPSFSQSAPMASGDKGECRLVGQFAILVQLSLGGLALLSLVYKRWRERPQRPVKIWFFDVSKQVFGSVLVHIANVFMSMLTSGRFTIKTAPAVVAQSARRSLATLLTRREEYMPNPCSLYLLNLAIDTTLGIPILIMIVKVATRLLMKTRLGEPPESIQSGNYGHPPKSLWWLKQSLIYFCGLLGMKIVVLIIFLMFPWIARVGDWALGWTEGDEKLQIIFVMMLFPLIMNALQYYIIDSYIKLSDRATEGDGTRSGPYEQLNVAEDLDSGDEFPKDDSDDNIRYGRNPPRSPSYGTSDAVSGRNDERDWRSGSALQSTQPKEQLPHE